MRIYVILYWFWEGDSHLVNSFVDIATNIDDADKIIAIDGQPMSQTYYVLESIPAEYHGNFGDPGFYQVIVKTLNAPL